MLLLMSTDIKPQRESARTKRRCEGMTQPLKGWACQGTANRGSSSHTKDGNSVQWYPAEITIEGYRDVIQTQIRFWLNEQN